MPPPGGHQDLHHLREAGFSILYGPEQQARRLCGCSSDTPCTPSGHHWLRRTVCNPEWAVSNNCFKIDIGKVATQGPCSPFVYGALTRSLGRRSESNRRCA